MKDERVLKEPTPEDVEQYQKKYPQVFEVHQHTLDPRNITKAIMAFEQLSQEEMFIHLIGLTLFLTAIETTVASNELFARLLEKKPAQA